jgi:rare lipoprotein A (peptidoglycan hydrolase)
MRYHPRPKYGIQRNPLLEHRAFAYPEKTADASADNARRINYRNAPAAPLFRLDAPGAYSRPSDEDADTIRAVASWYGWRFHGRHTANGELYNMFSRTAAHKELPFDTYLRITNVSNGRSTIVRINDRGPFVPGRDIDLSYRAAADLGMLETGVEEVRIQIIGD